DSGVETERVVGPGEVVVDRLRDADDGGGVLRIELRGYAESVLAADRDERFEAGAFEVRAHPLDAAVELVGIRAGGAEDRAAAGEQSRDLSRAKGLREPVHEPAPALADAEPVPAADHPQ